MIRRRWLILLLASVLLLVLVVGGGLLYVRTRTAREQVRTLVERALAQELNLPVRLGGVSLSLGVGSVELRHLAVVEGPAGPPLFEVDRVKVSLRLASLLRGDLRVRSVTIFGPRLSLEDTPRLRETLGKIVARLRELARAREAEGFPVRLQGGVIAYRDPATDVGVHLTGLNARISWPTPERALADVSVDQVQLRLGGREVSGIRLAGHARVGRDTVEVEQVRFTRGGSVVTLAGVVLTPTTVPRVELTATGELALDELGRATEGGKGWSGKLSVGGKLFGEGVPRTFEGSLGLLDGHVGGMPARLVTAQVLLRPDRLEVISLSALAGGGALRGSGVFEPGESRWRGSAQLTDVNLGDLLEVLGQPRRLTGRVSGTAEGSGQGKDAASLDLRVRLAGRELRLSDRERRADGEVEVTTARRGVLTVERLSLSRGQSRVALRGTVDLRTQTLALRATATVADLAKDFWPGEVKGLGGRLSVLGRVGQTLGKPLFTGRVSLRNMTFRGWRADVVEGPLEVGRWRLASRALRLSAGGTAATLSGAVELADGDLPWARWRDGLHLDLTADLKGRVEDVIAWPRTDWSVAGPVALHARFAGTLSTLEGGGQLEARELRVGPERFEALRAALTFKGSELHVPRLTVRRGGLMIQAEGAMDVSGRYRYSLLPVSLDLRTLPWLASLGVSGHAVLGVRGKGEWPETRVEGELTLADGVFRDARLGNGSARFALDGKEWRWDLKLAQGLRARGALPLALAGALQAEVTATDLDLMPFVPTLAAELRIPLTARADGRVTLRGTVPGLTDLSGRIELSALRGEAAGVSWRAREPARLALEAGTLRIGSLDLVGSGLVVEVRGSVRPGERTDLRLAGHAPFAVLAPWVPPLADLRGAPDVRLSLVGVPDDLKVTGRADLAHADLKLKAIPIWIAVVRGEVKFDNDTVQYAVSEGSAAGGGLESQGGGRRRDGRWGHTLDFKLDKARMEAIYDELQTGRRWASGDLFARGSFAFDVLPGQAVLPTLQGRVALTLAEGSLSRYPALVRIFGLLGTPAQPFRLPDLTRERMPYRRINADFSVRDGVMETKNLLLESEVVRVSGIGKVVLSDQSVNLDLAVRPLQVLEQGIRRIPLLGRLLPQEQSLVVAYFDITGPWTDPSITVAPVRSLSETVVDILLLLLKAPARVINPRSSNP